MSLPKHSPPTSAAPAQATHSHPPVSTLSSPSHPHLHSISTCLPSALSFAHLGLRSSQSSKICCLHAHVPACVLAYTLTAPLCTAEEGCVYTCSLMLSSAHIFSYVFACSVSPCHWRHLCSSVFSLLFLFPLFSLYEENSFHIISSSLPPSAAPGLPSGQPCAHSERVCGVPASRGGG